MDEESTTTTEVMHEQIKEHESKKNEKEVNITYETLFELLRREKNREELQQLDKNFFLDVSSYVSEKQQLLLDSKTKHDLFAATEKEKTRTQLDNIRRIIKELYERRQKKIINIALNSSRTDSTIVDTSPLLIEERLMYNLVLSGLNKVRFGVLHNVMEGKVPIIEDSAETKESECSQQSTETGEKESEASEKKENEETKIETKVIKFLQPVPKFVGPELEIYGPFEVEDMANIPVSIANVLISKERAEEIKE